MRELDQAQARRIRAEVLDSGQELSVRWLSVPGRRVVPAEEVSDLADDPLGVRILAAFAASGYEAVYCLVTTDLGPGASDQACLAALSEVDDWRATYAPFDVVLVAPDSSAAVLLSVDEFVLVGGSAGFVESVLGKTIAEGCAEFVAYAQDMAGASRHLPDLAQRWCAN
ncbi:hypothetical protein [Nocardia canadensis]|uniref:hypothetical protein n=1 Tax=Nocardia canadensis TaxID=3065238 RepID=UPI00292E8339|nr:hypothetical protein [Nocardia canadensis]